MIVPMAILARPVVSPTRAGPCSLRGRLLPGAEEVVTLRLVVVAGDARHDLAALHLPALVQLGVDVLPVAMIRVVADLALDHRGVGERLALPVAEDLLL